MNLFLHHFWSTDHIYRTVKAEQEPVLPAVATLLPPDQPSIVVAASGGGIQAAAWTARVLTGLQSVSGFSEHLRFISAVSGAVWEPSTSWRPYPIAVRLQRVPLIRAGRSIRMRRPRHRACTRLAGAWCSRISREHRPVLLGPR